MPFGAQIEDNPSQQSDILRLHPFGMKLLAGIFVGYAQQAGGGWTGDLFIADWQQIEQAEYSTDIHIKRFKAEEVEVVWKESDYCFPAARGDLTLPDDTREKLIRRTGHGIQYQKKENLAGTTQSGDPEVDEVETESAEVPATTPGEAEEHQVSAKDCWTLKGDMLIRHHQQPRTNLFGPARSSYQYLLNTWTSLEKRRRP